MPPIAHEWDIRIGTNARRVGSAVPHFIHRPTGEFVKKTPIKKAVIHSVRVAGSHRFGWKWRAEDGSRASADAYVYFYDCIQSAKKAGFECRFEGAQPDHAADHVAGEVQGAANA
jgi:hypothetical protein